MSKVLTITIQEQERIEHEFNRMIQAIKSDVSDEDRRQITAAYELARDAHSEQRRKSGEPYVMHPIEVARICADEIGLGPTAIVCALLHDVVEDTPVTLSEIRDQFSPKIADIVDGLTKLDGAYNVSSHQAANFKKVLSTLTEDVRVVLIKMADRLHNLRTIGSMKRQKQLKVAYETSYIYAPLAHRLGLYKIKTELEDLSFKVTKPEEYHNIARKLKDTKRQRDAYIDSFIKPLKRHIDTLDVEYEIFGRPKSIYSIWKKTQKKEVVFEEIYDLFAIRIIFDAPREREKPLCWSIYSIVTDVHTPIPERLRDWITTPKSNGYESLHTTVIGPEGRYVEVQIRSVRMDEIAERGFAAHWKYKGVNESDDVFKIWLDNIRDLLENNEGDAIDFVSDFKRNLFKDEVYVYTPQGDLKILPKGATALDFAFSIHTDIGLQCSAIKVNNKLVPMGYELENGDQVSVLTNKNQKPTEQWLSMVVSSKARSKIRHAINRRRKEKAGLGKEILERKFKSMKVDFTEENIDIIKSYFGFKSHFDLFNSLYKEEFSPSKLKELEVVDHNFEIPKHTPDEEVYKGKDPDDSADKIAQKESTLILLDGEPAQSYMYELAQCCHPLPGDDIFGFLTTGSGVKIHTETCPNAPNLYANYSYRIMKAEWAGQTESNFVAYLVMTGVDTGVGVIEKITSTISSKLGLNIRSFSIEGKEGYFEGKMSILVMNVNQLNHSIREIKNLEGISSVKRTES